MKDNYVEELTKPSFETSDSDPFFLDQDNVAFFHHGEDEISQIYVLNLKSKEQYRLTNFPISFENIKYNANKKLLAFSASVYNDIGTLGGTLKKDKIIEATKKDTGMVFDQLMVRYIHQKISQLLHKIDKY